MTDTPLDDEDLARVRRAEAEEWARAERWLVVILAGLAALAALLVAGLGAAAWWLVMG